MFGKGNFLKILFGEDDSQDEENAIKLKNIDDKYRSDINTLNELQIEQQSMQKTFEKENPDLTKQINEKAEEIKQVTAELSTIIRKTR